MNYSLFGFVALVFSAVSVFAKTPVAPYFVEQKIGAAVEIRRYPTALVAETEILNGDKNSAFRILAGYIFGKNETQKNIGMTAPVDMGSLKIGMTAPVDQVDSLGKTYMRFYMPTTFVMTTLPQPLDSRIQIREIPTSKRIAIRFAGRMSEANIAEHQAVLDQVVLAQHLEVISSPILSGYDAPWTPWFLRRNEISYVIQ